MTIRTANFADVPRLAELVQDGYARSIYAGRGSIDVKATKALMVSSIQRHGHKGEGGTLVLVAEHNGAVEGFMIGILNRVYAVLDKLMASDFMLYCSERADPADAGKLIRRLQDWGRKNPEVIEIVMGLHSLIEPWQRAAPLYERAGMTQTGAIYEMRTD
jgi:hypothetical protein